MAKFVIKDQRKPIKTIKSHPFSAIGIIRATYIVKNTLQ